MEEKKETSGKAAKYIFRLLGGSFFKNAKASELVPFFFFLTTIGILYIGNSYYAEGNIREISKIRKELKDLKNEHISIKSELISKNRPSHIAEKLKTKGIKESQQPPHKIIIK